MKTFILLFSLMVFTACKEGKDPYESIGIADNPVKNEHPGKLLMEKHCYLCHSPTADHDTRLAPPMIAIKRHYITPSTTKSEFKSAIQEWIKNPSDSMAKMRGAVRRFGLMPKAYYPEETIDQISEYLYDNEIEQPDWFEGHMSEKKGQHHGKKGHGQHHGKGKKMRQHKTHEAETNVESGI